ncbi:phospholipase A1 VesT1.02-like [Glandiceps talaboti]
MAHGSAPPRGFNVTDTGPAAPLISNLPDPWSLDVIQPRLRVFPKQQHREDYAYTHNNQSVTSRITDKITEVYHRDRYNSGKVVFIVHGFTNDIESEWMNEMKDALFLRREINTVILVGWGKGAIVDVAEPTKIYRQAAANTQEVGLWLGKIVSGIDKKRVVPTLQIWGIGHSLGAHVLGKAGRTANMASLRMFSRITGLDPAGPCFENYNHEKRLHKSHAKMVDVIHTDGYYTSLMPSAMSMNHFGTLIPLGTVDFYPNYGCEQPGCTSYTCSHHRAIEYFTWSISHEEAFKTRQVLTDKPAYEEPVRSTRICAREAQMCYFATKESRGNYYLQTNPSQPWQ